MKTRIVNGYNVTGNYGTGSARLYHVCTADGQVLRRADGLKPAVAAAVALTVGDVSEPEPKPEPVLATLPQKKAAAPKPAEHEEVK